jgi:hypothetical protein
MITSPWRDKKIPSGAAVQQSAAAKRELRFIRMAPGRAAPDKVRSPLADVPIRPRLRRHAFSPDLGNLIADHALTPDPRDATG